MLNLRYYLRLVMAFITRFRAILLIGIAIGVFFFLFFRFATPLLFSNNTTKIGLTGRVDTESLPPSILNKVGSGLTKMNDQGSVEPGIASSWSTPDKGKTWIFKVSNDAYWQDGEKVRSTDLNYTFTDVKVEKPDDATIIFNLSSPFGAFPSVVAKPVFKKGLLGTGEARVNKISLSGSFVQELTLIDKNKTKEIYKFYPTDERTRLAFKLGEVDKISNIYDPKPFTSWSNAVVTEFVDRNKVAAIFLNTEDKLLADKTFRQALSYATDKNVLGDRATGPISPTSWAFNPQVKTYDYDPKRAKELIESIPASERENISLKLTTSPNFLVAAEKVAKNWTDAGIKTEVQGFSGIPTEFQAFLVILDIPLDPDQYVLWHSTETGTNIAKYRNARIDKLLEDGRLEVDSEKRKNLYFDFQRFLLEDSPAIFLYHPIIYTISRK